MLSSDKPLNQMNRLADMLFFPAIVNAGATANVMLTIGLTWLVQPRYPALVLVWIAVVLAVNLTPVLLLRLTLRPHTPYPPLSRMDFFRDQHKFSDWVYLAASANMAFWILLAWTVSSLRHTPAALAGTLLIAFLLTFSPVLLRPLLTRTA